VLRTSLTLACSRTASKAIFAFSAASIFRRALFVMVCSAPSNNGAAALPIKHPVPKTGSASDRHTAVDYAHVLKTSPMPASRPPRSLFSSKTTSASTAKLHSTRPFGRRSQAVGRAVRMALPGWLNLAESIGRRVLRPSVSTATYPKSKASQRRSPPWEHDRNKNHAKADWLHNRDRAHQTQAPLPINLIESGD
jgi:hypothetical protein